MPSQRSRQVPRWLVGSGLIAVSMGVMNVSTYGFTLVSARVLGPAAYGALAALMGVILVLNVLSMALMATAARRVAVTGGHRRGIQREVTGTSVRAAAVLGALTLAATPLLSRLLRLESWLDAALVAVTIVPLTIMGAQSGLLQGERRWAALAAIFLGMGLGRIAFGLLGVLWRPDTTGAMLGVAVGAYVPVVIGWFALRQPPPAPPAASTAPSGSAASFLREVMHNAHALLAFFALSNTDVIVARILLGNHQSGLYAGGLILAKAVLFLPQFVVVLVFPSMAKSGERRVQTLALQLVAGISVLATAATASAPKVAVLFVGGNAYLPLTPEIWAFAAVGGLLAMLQILVYGTVARQHRSAVWVIWAAVVALVTVALSLVDSVVGLVATVGVVLAAVVSVLVLMGSRRPTPAEPPATPSRAGRP